MHYRLTQACLALALTGTVCFVGTMDRAQADAPTTAPTTSATTGPATTTASAISWDEAARHVGETLTVTGPVAGTHVTTGGKSLVLNIGKDFPDPSRFSIMIQLDKDTPATADSFTGKTVTVTGKIELYRKVPEIKAKQADVAIVP
jgi:DNA/RNA endonuclease YhcR with UshA esterase domain